MLKHKKLLSALLAAVMLFTVTGCGGTDDEAEDAGATSWEETANITATDETDEELYEQAIAEGSERALLALKVLHTHIIRYIGAYAMELGGLDALAFTGGIGENSARLRHMVMQSMAHMGVIEDEASNTCGTGEHLVSAADSQIAVYVIPANEEYMVVRETYRICSENKH